MTERVLAVIPARWASTRLPGKVLVPIAGKPMIQHVWEQASLSRRVDEVVIACDDAQVSAAAEAFGAKAVMTSLAHASGTDRITEVAANSVADIVLNIQGDEPLIRPQIVEDLARVMQEDDRIPMATVIKRIDNAEDLNNPNIVKVVVDQQGFALYFSRAAIPFDRSGQCDISAQAYFKHLGLYAYRKEFLLDFHALPASVLEQTEKLEQLRVLEAGHRIKTVETSFETISVDTSEDVEKVEAFLTAQAKAEV